MKTLDDLGVKVKIGEGGRIVIPARIRPAIGAEIGDTMTLRVHDKSLQITTPKEALRRLQALVREHVPEGVSFVDELIRERREEAADEYAVRIGFIGGPCGYKLREGKVKC